MSGYLPYACRSTCAGGARRGKVEAVDVKRIFQGVKEGMEAEFDDVEVSFAGMENTRSNRPFPTTAVDA